MYQYQHFCVIKLFRLNSGRRLINNFELQNGESPLVMLYRCKCEWTRFPQPLECLQCRFCIQPNSLTIFTNQCICVNCMFVNCKLWNVYLYICFSNEYFWVVAGLDPNLLPQEFWHGFSASWESSICEIKFELSWVSSPGPSLILGDVLTLELQVPVS